MKKSLLKTLVASACLVAATAALPAQAAEPGVKAGMLRCDVAAGMAFIFGSSKDLSCVYSPANGSAAQMYKGKIERFGVDIGYTSAGVILWTVFAPGPDVGPGGLKGNYTGASAEVTAGLGLGANVLVGGGPGSIALQPVSISGQEGLNIAAGIGNVTLQP